MGVLHRAKEYKDPAAKARLRWRHLQASRKKIGRCKGGRTGDHWDRLFQQEISRCRTEENGRPGKKKSSQRGEIASVCAARLKQSALVMDWKDSPCWIACLGNVEEASRRGGEEIERAQSQLLSKADIVRPSLEQKKKLAYPLGKENARAIRRGGRDG